MVFTAVPFEDVSHGYAPNTLTQCFAQIEAATGSDMDGYGCRFVAPQQLNLEHSRYVLSHFWCGMNRSGLAIISHGGVGFGAGCNPRALSVPNHHDAERPVLQHSREASLAGSDRQG
jgi:hypothetical protein